jgi:hypothetical protein
MFKVLLLQPTVSAFYNSWKLTQRSNDIADREHQRFSRFTPFAHAAELMPLSSQVTAPLKLEIGTSWPDLTARKQLAVVGL